MWRRYVTAAVITACLVGWLAAGAYWFLHLNTVKVLAESVGRSSRTVREEMEQPRVDLLGQRQFPSGRIAESVRAAWSEGLPVAAYPADLAAEPLAPSERARPR
jgi:hypothetical protein